MLAKQISAETFISSISNSDNFCQRETSWVNILSNVIEVFEHLKFITVDEDGSVYQWEHEPIWIRGIDEWIEQPQDDGEVEYLGSFELNDEFIEDARDLKMTLWGV